MMLIANPQNHTGRMEEMLECWKNGMMGKRKDNPKKDQI
jgi:hypothetical protein